jgi:hypothetical protein
MSRYLVSNVLSCNAALLEIRREPVIRMPSTESASAAASVCASAFGLLLELFMRSLLQDHIPLRISVKLILRIVVPKMPRRIPSAKLILFSALPIQMIGQAALPDLSREI